MGRSRRPRHGLRSARSARAASGTWSTARVVVYRLVSPSARITTSSAMLRSLPPTKPGDGEDDDEQRDGDDADADGAPHGRGQDSDAKICRFRLAASRAGTDRRLIITCDRTGGRRQRDLDRLGLAGVELGQFLRIEARLPALRRRRAELDISRRLAAVVLRD